MLAMYVSADHLDWDVTLPYVTFAYNSSRHDTAGYSPFFLLYGREPSLPLDTLLPDATPLTTEYARDAVAHADVARQVARAKLAASQSSQKHRYDEQHRTAHFTPGSLVLVSTPCRRIGLSEKLLPRFKGPYRIKRMVTPVTYEIVPAAPSSPSLDPSAQLVHVGRLKAYYSAAPPVP